MGQEEANLKTLVSKLQQLDETLIQRVSDFVDGIFAAQQKDSQEFPPLTEEEVKGVKEALEQAKNGEVYSEEEIKNMFLNENLFKDKVF